MKITFPKDFWWGSAASATQTEGTKSMTEQSIWDYWYEKEPNRFYDNVGPDVTSNFYNTYKEDIKLMKEKGHNSFRLSISWTRMINQDTGNINENAVEFYNNVINELIANGIEPFVNLYHFDMPMKQQNKGGFESREVVDNYVAYAQKCFDLYGDRVKKWFTFNEPIVPVEGGYLYNFHYPDINDAKRGFQYAFNTILANAKTIKLFKEQNYNGEIGIVLNLTPSYPRSENEEDKKAALIADLFFNKSFLDPATKGTFPEQLVEMIKAQDLMPFYKSEDLEIIKHNTVDLLGVNYYLPRRVKAKENIPNPNSPFTPEFYFDNYEMPGRKMNPYRGWEIYPEGLTDAIGRIRHR
ncbi:MAG: glycoside hydrolase family 1 protein, partial [Staphylococcus equorum]|nr:glycoside hydrolase family 1 protein [Staphylococcus equorum]